MTQWQRISHPVEVGKTAQIAGNVDENEFRLMTLGIAQPAQQQTNRGRICCLNLRQIDRPVFSVQRLHGLGKRGAYSSHGQRTGNSQTISFALDHLDSVLSATAALFAADWFFSTKVLIRPSIPTCWIWSAK